MLHKIYMNEVENQFGKKVMALRIDRGREYLSKWFAELCIENDIIKRLTTPYTIQQSGGAKRRKKTLLDMAKSMMAITNLPIFFW